MTAVRLSLLAWSRPRAILASLGLLAVLSACARPPEAASSVAPAQTEANHLQGIPAGDAGKVAGVRDLSKWQNPQLIVREDGIGFVDLSNHEIHILRPEQVPERLAALPLSAWPYGRVVLVSSAVPKTATDQMKADLRKNRGLLAGTLRDMNVEIREAP